MIDAGRLARCGGMSAILNFGDWNWRDVRRGAKAEGRKGRKNGKRKEGKKGEREGKESEGRSRPAAGHTQGGPKNRLFWRYKAGRGTELKMRVCNIKAQIFYKFFY